jgi:hypothetical protein
MNQAVIKGTKEPFNDSSNDYGNMRAVHKPSNDYGHMGVVQRIKQELREQKCRLMNQALTTGT